MREEGSAVGEHERPRDRAGERRPPRERPPK
jgi:hypothetical protein